MDYIEALGTSGSMAPGHGTTCLQVAKNVLIDAGNIINALGDEAVHIEHIFLTHSHFDHISDIPALLDLFYDVRVKTLHLYGLDETLKTIQNSLLNHKIFPDFHTIDLVDKSAKSLEYHIIEMGEEYDLGAISLMPFPTNHTVASCGYVIRQGGVGVAFTSDTAASSEVYALINHDLSIQTLITEVSYPATHEERAKLSGHLTTASLGAQLTQLRRDDVRILLMHLKPNHKNTIEQEVHAMGDKRIAILQDGDKIPYGNLLIRPTRPSIHSHYDTLLKTGIALTSEHNLAQLSELILRSARQLTQSDAGTLYLLGDDEKSLYFQSIQNDSLKIDNHASGTVPEWNPIPLYNRDGSENHSLATSHCALTKKLVKVDDVYGESESFDFHSTIQYDTLSGYRSRSMLLMPLLDYQGHLIGVLQLINKTDDHGHLIAFCKEDEQVISALGSQAVVSITNQRLINDLELLFKSFLHSINLTMEKKSPYMQGHVQKMTGLSLMIAKAIDADKTIFPDISYSDSDIQTIEMAAMMHDIGKITTPIYIIDKSKKLEKIQDRIETIRYKFDLLRAASNSTTIHSPQVLTQEQINDAYDFLLKINNAEGYFDEKAQKKLKEIEDWKITIDNKTIPILTPDEYHNLSIPKGTLTNEERTIIEDHAKMSIDFLSAIKFPKKYQRVPEIAGSHHEKINGKGYPMGLKGEEISLEARILAVADIFEALTAADRPYKKPNALSEAMNILYIMAKNHEIDYDICMFFYESGLYMDYAKKYMSESQIDPVEMEW